MQIQRLNYEARQQKTKMRKARLITRCKCVGILVAFKKGDGFSYASELSLSYIYALVHGEQIHNNLKLYLKKILTD